MLESVERELAWAAGLFEGEGSIHCNNINGRKYLVLNLSSNDRDVVERFTAAIGCGKIYGPYLEKNAKNPRWSWHATNKADAEQSTLMLEPYLCERRRAKLAHVRDEVANQRPCIRSGWKLSPEHCQAISDRMKKTWAERKAAAA